MKRALILLMVLGGCGGSPPQPSQPEDETLKRATSAGELAYTLERPEEAVAQYKAALTRAQERDDITAIGDLGFNLAVAELRADDPDDALSVARATREELERRKQTAFPALLLAEATALFRLGRLDEAGAMAARAQAGSDTQTSARSIFLIGLIADQRGDIDALAAAVAALHPGDQPSFKADASELAARLALRRGEAGQAVTQAEQAAALRQEAIDYRGLARALALAGQGAKQSGDTAAAADLFLRSGRSAAAQHDTVSARLWLQQAVALGGGLAVGEAAQALLRELDQSTDRAGDARSGT
jgi:hypothetical protein